MENYLNIISLALAIAALMPVLLASTRVRFWTLTAAALSFVVLVGGYQTYQVFSEQHCVRVAKEDIWGLLKKHEKGLTFEQIYDNLYYCEFSVANAALDELVEEGRVLNEKFSVTDQQGTKYVVRKFYRRFGD